MVAINHVMDENEVLKQNLAVVLGTATRQQVNQGSKVEDAIIDVGMFAISFTMGGVLHAMGKEKPSPKEGRVLIASIVELLQALPDKE